MKYARCPLKSWEYCLYPSSYKHFWIDLNYPICFLILGRVRKLGGEQSVYLFK